MLDRWALFGFVSCNGQFASGGGCFGCWPEGAVLTYGEKTMAKKVNALVGLVGAAMLAGCVHGVGHTNNPANHGVKSASTCKGHPVVKAASSCKGHSSCKAK